MVLGDLEASFKDVPVYSENVYFCNIVLGNQLLN